MRTIIPAIAALLISENAMADKLSAFDAGKHIAIADLAAEYCGYILDKGAKARLMAFRKKGGPRFQQGAVAGAKEWRTIGEIAYSIRCTGALGLYGEKGTEVSGLLKN